MNRRKFAGLAALSAFSAVTGCTRKSASPANHPSGRTLSQEPLETRWRKLDDAIRTWWDKDLHSATEDEVRKDAAKTLIFLPFPYITAGGSEAAFPELYGWDTQFINAALLAHGRSDIVRNNILDQLTMIERFGMVLNGNRTFYLTRGQPPLLAWSIQNYLAANKTDDELALRAFPNLVDEYTRYWNGPAHLTNTGLATCRDSGDKSLRPELAAEAETGTDFTPIYHGDVRQCVPISINSALVCNANVIASIAERFGWQDKAKLWREEANRRAALINQYCWDPVAGYYFEYDYIARERLPFYSLDGFWPLWAGVASASQAQRVRDHLGLFDKPYGLTYTDKVYPSPHPEFTNLQWAYPSCWPPEQMIVAAGLQRYNFQDDNKRLNLHYIENVVTTWEETGQTWERYNAVTGGHDCPVERAPSTPMHGWSASSAVVLGHMLFG